VLCATRLRHKSFDAHRELGCRDENDGPFRPAAVKAGVIKEDQRVRFGFHNFRHSLASSLVKLKCDPKTVQGILRHEDVRTTMQLYAQSDQESRLEAQGKFLALLLGDKAHL